MVKVDAGIWRRTLLGMTEIKTRFDSYMISTLIIYKLFTYNLLRSVKENIGVPLVY